MFVSDVKESIRGLSVKELDRWFIENGDKISLSARSYVIYRLRKLTGKSPVEVSVGASIPDAFFDATLI